MDFLFGRRSLDKWGIESNQDEKLFCQSIRKKTEGLSLAFPLCIHLQNMKIYLSIFDFCLDEKIIQKESDGWKTSANICRQTSELLNNLVVGIESFDTSICVKHGSYSIFQSKSKL